MINYWEDLAEIMNDTPTSEYLARAESNPESRINYILSKKYSLKKNYKKADIHREQALAFVLPYPYAFVSFFASAIVFDFEDRDHVDPERCLSLYLDAMKQNYEDEQKLEIQVSFFKYANWFIESRRHSLMSEAIGELGKKQKIEYISSILIKFAEALSHFYNSYGLTVLEAPLLDYEVTSIGDDNEWLGGVQYYLCSYIVANYIYFRSMELVRKPKLLKDFIHNHVPYLRAPERVRLEPKQRIQYYRKLLEGSYKCYPDETSGTYKILSLLTDIV